MFGLRRERVSPPDDHVLFFDSTHRRANPAMAVLCAKCGEELLGAINRCWRCGTEYESHRGRSDVPPIRRAPIRAPLGDVEVVDDAADDADIEPTRGGQPNRDHQPTSDHQPILNDSGAGATVAHLPPMRRGSPFRSAATAGEGDSMTEFALSERPSATKYPKYGGASVGSVLAITLGLLGLGLANLIPVASLLIAGVGLGMGIWGLNSKKRRAALFGLVLCCLAVTLSGFFSAAEVYRAIHGVTPWEYAPYSSP